MKELDRLAEQCALETCHKDANERIPIIRSAIDQALAIQRGEVIEECAKVCDALYEKTAFKGNTLPLEVKGHNAGTIHCATAIRALKG